jgi:threonine dehydratase
MAVELSHIRAAAERLRGHIRHTPCLASPGISRLCGGRVHCKQDQLQLTGSFKERGARNKLALLSPAQRALGVITASAGNHALGLAYHGQQLGIPVTVVMPNHAPLVKSARCRSYGAEVIHRGEHYEEAGQAALALSAEGGKLFVHGFEDDDIIAGQGTLGLEILADVPEVDVVVVPVGGGGLIAGIGVAIKALKPAVRIIAVEAAAAPTIGGAMREGRPVRVVPRPTLADGLAVGCMGERCFAIARRVIDQVVAVDETSIASAILTLMEVERTVVEGAGAVALAAAMGGGLDLGGATAVLVLGGGNIDVSVMAQIIERGLVHDGRLCRIAVQLDDRPGSLARLLTLVAETGASVKEVMHDRLFSAENVARVSVSVIAETRDHAHVEALVAALTAGGFTVDHLD